MRNNFLKRSIMFVLIVALFLPTTVFAQTLTDEFELYTESEVYDYAYDEFPQIHIVVMTIEEAIALGFEIVELNEVLTLEDNGIQPFWSVDTGIIHLGTPWLRLGAVGTNTLVARRNIAVTNDSISVGPMDVRVYDLRWGVVSSEYNIRPGNVAIVFSEGGTAMLPTNFRVEARATFFEQSGLFRIRGGWATVLPFQFLENNVE